MTALVLGADCGGTTTRVVAATVDGRIVGRGRGGPGNPVAREPAATAAALGSAVGQALRGYDPGRVVGAVAGVAGASRLDEPATAATYSRMWVAAGLRCPMRAVGDAVVAFAAGTSEPSGTVLIAGTGVVAAEITDRGVRRIADGLGWLLGDEGSGFWLGLAAARVTARTLYRGAPAGPLVDAVCADVGSTDADTFVTRVYQVPRDRIAALARVVTDSARAGDPAARSIVATAADRLVDTVASLAPGPGPIVLAGGVLAAVAEIRDAVLLRLDQRLGRSALVAGDGAVGAAWLAAAGMVASARPAAAGPDLAGVALHARMRASGVVVADPDLEFGDDRRDVGADRAGVEPESAGDHHRG